VIIRVSDAIEFVSDVVCQFGICVHSEWTYVRWEFMSIPNRHMSDWNRKDNQITTL